MFRVLKKYDVGGAIQSCCKFSSGQTKEYIKEKRKTFLAIDNASKFFGAVKKKCAGVSYLNELNVLS
jgi:hypothetical protein